ncbi:hypothetical protein B0A48_00979 [Cryoendolithus antarcticus]|uniref:Uncharacterized protein n=1 Tax=Cryoendolithus antarcticus TaxID=1507870 RepID=A0A1V8TRX0_9PEZI|nr:hypothetical protein B0A48_00979 [Cryoendolithus antarcticus]
MDSSRLASSPPQSATRSSSPAPDATPGGGGLQPSPLFKANMSIIPSSGGLFSPSKDQSHDSLRSDAIDGPEDFTIHLVDYMAGQPARVQTRSMISGTPAMTRERDDSVRRLPLSKDLDSPPRSISGSGRLGRTRLASSSSPPRERAAPGAVAFMRSHIERLEEDLAAERRMREADMVAHTTEVERVTSVHREELEAMLEELQSVKKAREADIKSVAAQYTEQVRVAFEQERNRHKGELDSVRNEIVRSREKNAEIDVDDTIVVEQERLKHLQDVDRLEAQHNKALEDAAEEIKELRAQLGQKSQDKPTAERERRQVADELKRVKKITKDHLQAAQEEIDQLQVEVDRQKHVAEELDEARETIRALEAQAAEAAASSKRTGALQDELLELRLQLATRDQRIAELSNELQAQPKQSQPTQQAPIPQQHDSSVAAAQLALRTEDYNRATARALDLERLNTRYAKQLQIANHTADNLKASHTAELQRTVAEHEREKAAEVDGPRRQLSASHRGSKSSKASTAELTEQLAKQSLRVSELEKLNKELGNQLMRAWGREEFGDTGEKQKYRYKYVKA